MQDLKLLDLANRKARRREATNHAGRGALPFIFMNAVGLQPMVETILHRTAMRSTPWPHAARICTPIQCADRILRVASMSMELLGTNYRKRFTTRSTQPRAPDASGGIDEFSMDSRRLDAFQHWIYTIPAYAPGAVRHLGELMERFGAGGLGGCEAARASLWHRQLQFSFTVYYIEYGGHRPALRAPGLGPFEAGQGGR